MRIVVFGTMMAVGAGLLIYAWRRELGRLLGFLFLRTGRATRRDLFRAMFFSVLLGYFVGLLELPSHSWQWVIGCTAAVVVVCGSIMGIILLLDPEIRAFRDRTWK